MTKDEKTYKFGDEPKHAPNRKERRAALAQSPRWLREMAEGERPLRKLKHQNPRPPKSAGEEEMAEYYSTKNALKRQRRGQP